MAYDVKLLKAMIGDHFATSGDMVSKYIREIIDDETDLDEVGCILEMMSSEVAHASKKFNEFYESRPENFKDFKVRVGNWCVEWEYIGEGCDGDYDWQDPDDLPMLRANLSYKNKPCTDGSYCTQATTTTSKKELKAASHELIRAVVLEVDKKEWKKAFFEVDMDIATEVNFPDRIMQKWTWREYKT